MRYDKQPCGSFLIVQVLTLLEYALYQTGKSFEQKITEFWGNIHKTKTLVPMAVERGAWVPVSVARYKTT